MARHKVLLAQIVGPHTHREDALADMSETESLVSTLGGAVVHKTVQHRYKPDRATYLGSGKVLNLKKIDNAKKVDIIILNDVVDASVLYRLEKSFWKTHPHVKIWDRVDLILQIFDKHAVSTAAKLQIELARIRHMGPRIYGLGKTLLTRQAGGIGTRGLGETNIELMRRHHKKYTRQLKEKLKKIQKAQMKTLERRRQAGVSTVSLVGYTNAGKTSLFNALTGKKKKVEDKLFATLDTTVGRIKNQKAQGMLVSDTIGFIRDLPPSLIETFKSTLLETVHADLILHVVDISDPHLHEKVDVVDQILQDLSIPESKVLLVLNKVDRCVNGDAQSIASSFKWRKPLLVSAQKGIGMNTLVQRVLQHGDLPSPSYL